MVGFANEMWTLLEQIPRVALKHQTDLQAKYWPSGESIAQRGASNDGMAE